MFNKLLYKLFISVILLSAIVEPALGRSFLINQSELSSISADAVHVGILITPEMLELQMQLEDLDKKHQAKLKEISIAGNTHTSQSSLITNLHSDLKEIENEITNTENQLLKAGMQFSIKIGQIDQEIESEYLRALKDLKPETNEFRNIKSRYSASKRLRQKFQRYQVLFQARQTLSSHTNNLFECITAYARLLYLDPGNKEAIEYCQEKLKWDSSDDSIFVLNNIDQFSSDTITTLYNNGIEIVKYGSYGIEFCWIPPGSYSKPTIEQTGMMKKKAESEIIITKGFWLSRYEITVGQYLEFLNSTRTFDKKHYYPEYEIKPEILNFNLDLYNCFQITKDMFLGDPDKPMIMVSYNDAVDFCKWLSGVDGIKYTLPTEAQWELAGRANAETKWHFGDDIEMLDDYAWYGKLSQLATEEVGKLKPNLYGLYDMYGNSWEWCLDWYSEIPFAAGKVIDPIGKKLSNTKVIRGGSWQSQPEICSSSGRNSATPELQDKAIGFRIMQVIKQ